MRVADVAEPRPGPAAARAAGPPGLWRRMVAARYDYMYIAPALGVMLLVLLACILVPGIVLGLPRLIAPDLI